MNTNDHRFVLLVWFKPCKILLNQSSFPKRLLNFLLATQLLWLTSCFPAMAQNSTAQNSPLQTLLEQRFTEPQPTIEALKQYQNQLGEKLSDNQQRQISRALILLWLKLDNIKQAQEEFNHFQKLFEQKNGFEPKSMEVLLALYQHQTAKANLLLKQMQIEIGNLSVENRLWLIYLQGSHSVQIQNYDIALKLLTDAIKIADSNLIIDLQLGIRNQLIQILFFTQQYSSALLMVEEMLTIASQHNDSISTIVAMSNKLNILYAQSAQISAQQTHQQLLTNVEYQVLIQQIYPLQQQLERLTTAENATKHWLRTMIVKQNLFLNQEDFQSVIEIGEQIVEIASNHSLDYEKAVAINNVGIGYRYLGHYQQSIEWLMLAKQQYETLENRESSIWILQDLAETYQAKGDIQTALDLFNQYYQNQSENEKQKNQERTLQLRESFLSEIKTKEIEQLKQREILNKQALKLSNLQLSLLMFFCLIIVLFAIALLQNRRKLNQLLAFELKINSKNQELEKAKQRFFSNLSHEFRNALTLSISPLKQFIHEQPEHQDRIDSALKQNLHMLSLLNELMAINDFDSQRPPCHIQNVSILAIINRVAVRFSHALKEKLIHINIVGLTDQHCIQFDIDHLDKVISNLFSNAVKYSNKESQLTIVWQQNDKHQSLSFIDQGPGVTAQELPLLATRFYQGQHSSSQSLPGTGIGLSLVKELMQLHGGAVYFESNPEHGLTVRLEFADHIDAKQNSSIGNDHLSNVLVLQKPLKHDDQKNRPTDVLFAVNIKKTVLIVDDNASIRRLIRQSLVLDYDVIETENGQQALLIAESTQPDLMIVDLVMPEMSGLDLIRMIRQQTATQHLSIMVLSALSHSQQITTAFKLGVDDYLTKPFDLDELKARVASHLENQERRAQTIYQQLLKTPGGLISVNNSQNTSKHRPRQLSLTEQRKQQLEELIAQNLSQSNFEIDLIFSTMNMTRSSLFRFVQKHYQTTPILLVKKRRMDSARQLLIHQSLTISEVAYAVGYQSLSAFSRAFTEYFQLSPSQLRREKNRSDDDLIKVSSA